MSRLLPAPFDIAPFKGCPHWTGPARIPRAFFWTDVGISPQDMESRVILVAERIITTTVTGIEHMVGQGRRNAGIRIRGWRTEFSQCGNERESGRDCCRLYDDVLPLPNRRTRNAGIPDDARSVLACSVLRYYLGRHQAT